MTAEHRRAERLLADLKAARVVTLDDIAANDHNLNIPRYVEPISTQEVLTVEAAMKQLRKSADAAFVDSA